MISSEPAGHRSAPFKQSIPRRGLCRHPTARKDKRRRHLGWDGSLPPERTLMRSFCAPAPDAFCRPSAPRPTGGRPQTCAASSAIRSLAFSASIAVGAFVFEPIRLGKALLSHTRRPWRPRTLRRVSTTLASSDPHPRQKPRLGSGTDGRGSTDPLRHTRRARPLRRWTPRGHCGTTPIASLPRPPCGVCGTYRGFRVRGAPRQGRY